MVPKMEACLRAVRGRRAAARHVVDGRVPHAVLLEIFTTEGDRHDGAARGDDPQIVYRTEQR